MNHTLPLPSQPKLVLIYRPRRDGRLSWHLVAGWLHTDINKKRKFKVWLATSSAVKYKTSRLWSGGGMGLLIMIIIFAIFVCHETSQHKTLSFRRDNLFYYHAYVKARLMNSSARITVMGTTNVNSADLLPIFTQTA